MVTTVLNHCLSTRDRITSVCDSVTHFVITAYAANAFGDGPPSNPVYVNMTDIATISSAL